MIEFDQNTIANMTAALDYVCKKIPPESESESLRKSIGNEIIRSAQSGKRDLIDMQEAGLRVLKAALKPKKKFGWFGMARFFGR